MDCQDISDKSSGGTNNTTTAPDTNVSRPNVLPFSDFTTKSYVANTTDVSNSTELYMAVFEFPYDVPPDGIHCLFSPVSSL